MSSDTALTTANPASAGHLGEAAYELRFRSLFHEGRAIAVPCDARGHVELDRLTERLRNAYFGVRKLVGAEYACPVLQRTH